MAKRRRRWALQQVRSLNKAPELAMTIVPYTKRRKFQRIRMTSLLEMSYGMFVAVSPATNKATG
jgi:hypothetical protein